MDETVRDIDVITLKFGGAVRRARAEAEAPLAYLGDDPQREGLLDAPVRATGAFAGRFPGCGRERAVILGADVVAEISLGCGIPSGSRCERRVARPFSPARDR
jgi:GTP cyclohydrolase I